MFSSLVLLRVLATEYLGKSIEVHCVIDCLVNFVSLFVLSVCLFVCLFVYAPCSGLIVVLVVRRNARTGLLEPSPNYTVLNAVLHLMGPMTEQGLVVVLVTLQVVCCFLGILVRYSPLYTIFL